MWQEGTEGFFPFPASPSAVGSPRGGGSSGGGRAGRALRPLGAGVSRRWGGAAASLSPAASHPSLRLPRGASLSACSPFTQPPGRQPCAGPEGGVPFLRPLPGQARSGLGPAEKTPVASRCLKVLASLSWLCRNRLSCHQTWKCGCGYTDAAESAGAVCCELAKALFAAQTVCRWRTPNPCPAAGRPPQPLPPPPQVSQGESASGTVQWV